MLLAKLKQRRYNRINVISVHNDYKAKECIISMQDADNIIKQIPVIQWFPGHMQKTRKLIQENLKLVDVVVELVDARVPVSSRNPWFQEILKSKPHIIALNKADLADSRQLKAWIKWFKDNGTPAVSLNSVTGQGIRELVQLTANASKKKDAMYEKKGAFVRATRAMILGIPNVGKSSLINRLAGKARAKVENRPGVTRDKQWIRLRKDLDLLDTPGVLWPKFEDPSVGLKLAWIGSINDDVYDTESAVLILLEWLRNNYKIALSKRYNIEADELDCSPMEIFEKIGKKRGCLLKGGVIDTEKTMNHILSDFRQGNLGGITLDEIPEGETDGL